MLGLFNLKIVFKDEYEKLVEDWENQNKLIDTQRTIIKGEKKIRDKEKAEFEQQIANMKENHVKSVKKYEGEKAYLQIQLEKANEKYEEVEKLRRSYAGKNGGYVKQINKLEAQINELEEKIHKLEKCNEFLKNNQRKPDVEDVKDYLFGRKEVLKRKRNKKAS